MSGKPKGSGKRPIVLRNRQLQTRKQTTQGKSALPPRERGAQINRQPVPRVQRLQPGEQHQLPRKSTTQGKSALPLLEKGILGEQQPPPREQVTQVKSASPPVGEGILREQQPPPRKKTTQVKLASPPVGEGILGEQQLPPRKKTTQVKSASPPLKPRVRRIGPKTFDEYWKDTWQKIERDKIRNAPASMQDDLLARRDREAAVDNEIVVLEREHVAFMQGSNIIYLPTILAEGRLLCSDILRTLGRRTFAKDAGNGTGDVCYFRFIMDTRPGGQLDVRIVKRNINNFSSVGSSGGVFYVMRADDVEGLTYRTASSTDSKGWGSATIEQVVVGSNVWKKDGNNTEIGFSRAVEFVRISEVYIRTDALENEAMGQTIYNNAVALLEELEQKGISLPEKWRKLSQIKRSQTWGIPLTGFFLEMAGFTNRGNVRTKKGEFDVFVRTGEPDYVRGFLYDSGRGEAPYPLVIPQGVSVADPVTAKQDSPAGQSEASEEVPPAEQAAASESTPSAKPSVVSDRTSVAESSEPTPSAEDTADGERPSQAEQGAEQVPSPKQAKPSAVSRRTSSPKRAKSSSKATIVTPKAGSTVSRRR